MSLARTLQPDAQRAGLLAKPLLALHAVATGATGRLRSGSQEAQDLEGGGVESDWGGADTVVTIPRRMPRAPPARRHVHDYTLARLDSDLSRMRRITLSYFRVASINSGSDASNERLVTWAWLHLAGLAGLARLAGRAREAGASFNLQSTITASTLASVPVTLLVFDNLSQPVLAILVSPSILPVHHSPHIHTLRDLSHLSRSFSRCSSVLFVVSGHHRRASLCVRA